MAAITARYIKHPNLIKNCLHTAALPQLTTINAVLNTHGLQHTAGGVGIMDKCFGDILLVTSLPSRQCFSFLVHKSKDCYMQTLGRQFKIKRPNHSRFAM